MNAESAQIELPKYKCHKEVWGLQIKDITGFPSQDEEDTGRRKLHFFREEYGPIEIDVKIFDKHRPKEGWYYVIYKGGYISFSPAKEFEDGYSEIKR